MQGAIYFVSMFFSLLAYGLNGLGWFSFSSGLFIIFIRAVLGYRHAKEYPKYAARYDPLDQYNANYYVFTKKMIILFSF
eukprot:UN04535